MTAAAAAAAAPSQEHRVHTPIGLGSVSRRIHTGPIANRTCFFYVLTLIGGDTNSITFDTCSVYDTIPIIYKEERGVFGIEVFRIRRECSTNNNYLRLFIFIPFFCFAVGFPFPFACSIGRTAQELTRLAAIEFSFLVETWLSREQQSAANANVERIECTLCKVVALSMIWFCFGARLFHMPTARRWSCLRSHKTVNKMQLVFLVVFISIGISLVVCRRPIFWRFFEMSATHGSVAQPFIPGPQRFRIIQKSNGISLWMPFVRFSFFADRRSVIPLRMKWSSTQFKSIVSSPDDFALFSAPRKVRCNFLVGLFGVTAAKPRF